LILLFCETFNIKIKRRNKKIRKDRKRTVQDATKPIRSFDINTIYTYLKFVGMSYSTKDESHKESFLQDVYNAGMLQYTGELVVSSKDKSKVEVLGDDYNIQIYYNKKLKKYIILFPGTRKTRNYFWEDDQLTKEGKLFNLTDTLFFPSNIKIPKYAQELLLLFGPEFKRYINDVILPWEDSKDAQFIFIGHSLGGMMASIFALYSVCNGVTNKEQTVLITFGAPKAGNQEFVDELDKRIPLNFIFKRQNDFVTLFPFSEAINRKISFINIVGKSLGYSVINPEIKDYKHYMLLDQEMKHLYFCTDEEDKSDKLCKYEPTGITSFINLHLYYFAENTKVSELSPNQNINDFVDVTISDKIIRHYNDIKNHLPTS
jgi:hypothetical protein